MFRTGTEGRHGGRSAAGAPPPSVVGCVLRTIVCKPEFVASFIGAADALRDFDVNPSSGTLNLGLTLRVHP